MKLSVVILTNNNEKTIRKTLESVLFAQEIVVVDSGSTDETLEIIDQYLLAGTYNISYSQKNLTKIRVFKRDLKNDFANQRNFGLEKCTHKWVLYLDSDEVVTKKLQKEIIKSIKNSKISGFFIKRQDKFLGKILKHGETANCQFLRLAQKQTGEWHGKVHETWQIKGETQILENYLIHNHQLDIADFLKRLNWYSSLHATQFYEKKQKESLVKIFVNPIGKFFYNYIWLQGWRDGKAGFIMAWLMSWHSFLVRIKLQLLWLNRGQNEFKLK